MFSKTKWHKQSATTWQSNVERTYYAIITFSAPGTYAVEIFDEDDVSTDTSDEATLKLAKNFFRRFLLTE